MNAFRFRNAAIARIFIFLLAGILPPLAGAQSFVQLNAGLPSSGAVVSVVYASAQTAGNLNVVVVGWSDSTATVSTVTDTKGNVYTLAVGPIVVPGAVSQSIYYAKNIAGAAAGGNTVTVKFSTAASYPDVRILEYSGLDVNNPLDGGMGGVGSATTSDSGALVTTNGNDLLVGANTVLTSTTGAGAGYTSRIITDPDGDLAEDQVVTAVGSYHATAGLSSGGSWVMEVVGFKAAGAAPAPTAPGNLVASPVSTTQINLTWVASTETGGTVSSYLVERCVGAGCTNFAQVGTSSTTSYNDTGLGSGTSYSYRVRGEDTGNSVGPYSNTATGITQGTAVPTAPGNLVGVAGASGPVVVATQGYINATSQPVHTTNAFDSTGGDLLVICVSSHGGVTMTPSDSYGNSWILGAGPTSTTVGFDLRTGVWYARNPTVGTGHTVTVSLSAAQPVVISVFVVKGSNIGTPIDGISAIGSDGGTQTESVSSPSIVTTKGYDLLIGFAKSSINEVWTAGTGYTEQAGASSAYLNAETGQGVTPGSYAATFGINGAATWQAAVVGVSPSAAAASPNQVNLTWTASTETGGTVSSYLVERCVGAGCTSFTQIGTSTNTTFNDTSVSSATTYIYRARAMDTFNDVGSYSNTATVTMPAGTIPTAPGNLTATALSSTQVSLAWVASTENGGTIASYLVERCQGSACSNFTQIGTTATTTFNDSGLTASTNYSYRVRATDATNTTGPYSNTASVTTSAPSFTAPTGLMATDVGPAQINLAWTAATDSGGTITSYLIERCAGTTCSNFAQVSSSPTTSYSDTGVLGSTTYSYRVRATDSSNNFSPYSNTATATTTAPTFTAPASLTATVSSPVQINLSWTGATETGGTISSYLVESCQGAGCTNFVQIGASTTTTFNNTGLRGSTSYSYRVRATDAANNLGPYSPVSTATTAAPIFTAPATLTATASSTTQINLSWTVATETGGTISNYLVESCQGVGCTSFTQIGASATLAFSNTGLTGSTSYSYRVRATDAAGDLGPYSSVTTTATPAATPTAPTNLAATAASNIQINLSWTASTETGGTIASYLVERCQGSSCTNFVQVGASTTNTFASGGLTGSTTYRFRVRAQDTQNNLGPYSNIAAATTAVPTITAPTSLTATAASAVQVNLSWVAATETGGTITNYLVERCQGVGCTSFTQIGTSATLAFNNTGLTGSTTYIYRVRATDAAGNLGSYSTTATALTAAPVITAPSNLNATAVSNTQINLSWTAATETGGTTSAYLVERCQGASCTNFAQVGTSATVSLSDSGLTASTSYSYRVRATDAANDLGPYSNAASATTLATAPPPPSVSFVQLNAGLPSSGATVSVVYASVQTAGNLNVVVVGWSDSTATVSTVTDTKGNVYTLAVGPIVVPGAVSQSIYYAKNIAGAAAGGNTVTVKFSTAASYPDVRILEYSGLDVNNPLDGGVGGVGSATTSDSGALVTTNGNDLLVGANTVLTSTTGAGAGYTNRIITDPDGDLVEDKVVTAVGSYHATAGLSSGGSWVMEVVGFKAAGAAPAPTAPGNLVASPVSTTQINLTWVASTETGGTVSSYLVERCVGAGCTNFAQVGTSSTTSYNDMGLGSGTSYSYRVRGEDTGNSVGPYSNTATGITQGTAVPTAPGNLVGVAGASGPVVVATQGYINATSQPVHTTNAFDSTGGDLLVICVSSHGGVTMTPSDSYGNSWILGAGPTSTTVGFDLRTGVWYARNPTVGTGHTVTVSLSAAQPVVISVFVVKGSNIGTPIDGISAIGSDGGTQTESVSSPSIVTTNGYDLLIGFAKSSINEVWTAGTGYTEQAGASSAYLNAETGQGVTPGSYAATFGINGAATWQAAVVGVSPSAAAASPNQVNLTWTASTETGGTVSSYLVERCVGAGCTSFTQIGTSTNTTFNDTSVSSATTYVYRVRAKDISNALGPYSATATVAMP